MLNLISDIRLVRANVRGWLFYSQFFQSGELPIYNKVVYPNK